MNRSIVCPAQEFRDITNEIIKAKKKKLGTGVVPEHSRKNPDSSSGLAVTAEKRANAQRVHRNKKAVEVKKEKKTIETAAKKSTATIKRGKEFDRVVENFQNSYADFSSALTTHTMTENIKLSLQHLCGSLSHLPES